MKPYPVIVALDGLSLGTSLSIARQLKGRVWGFKVHELAYREGFSIIKKLKRYGSVFADFKLHDIPHTVELEVAALIALGADIISVHASGGREVLDAAVRAGGRKIAAVTVLTSLPKAEARKTLALAALARTAGVTTIVASPQELSALKKLSKTTRYITPGIRPHGFQIDDQKRTATASAALVGGASLLVIGRPITLAKDPRHALEALMRA